LTIVEPGFVVIKLLCTVLGADIGALADVSAVSLSREG
jgi:hypothetical protein